MENEKAARHDKPALFAVIVCECILALAVIITALTLKFFIPSAYKPARQWYADNVTADIDVKRIIEGAKDEI